MRCQTSKWGRLKQKGLFSSLLTAYLKEQDYPLQRFDHTNSGPCEICASVQFIRPRGWSQKNRVCLFSQYRVENNSIIRNGSKCKMLLFCASGHCKSWHYFKTASDANRGSLQSLVCGYRSLLLTSKTVCFIPDLQAARSRSSHKTLPLRFSLFAVSINLLVLCDMSVVVLLWHSSYSVYSL